MCVYRYIWTSYLSRYPILKGKGFSSIRWSYFAFLSCKELSSSPRDSSLIRTEDSGQITDFWQRSRQLKANLGSVGDQELLGSPELDHPWGSVDCTVQANGE